MAFGLGISGCACCLGGESKHGLVISDTGPGFVGMATSIDGVTVLVVAATTETDPAAPQLPAADTVDGGVGSTATVTVGGSTLVTIDTLGDHDWYQVTLTAGQTYTIQTHSDGSGTDAFLNLRDAAGVLITSNDDDGDNTNSLITFTATTTGTYFIDAGTYNNESTGGFHLAVAAAAPAGDFVGATTGTAAALAIGGSVNGNIDAAGDRDYYAVNLVAGQTYIFRTSGTASTTTTDTLLTLRDASGTQLLANDDAGEAAFSAIRYTATTTGTFYLDVSGFSNATGAFNLTAFTAPTPVVYTYDQIATQLTSGYWGGSSRHFNVAPGGSLNFNVTALTTDGANLARAALALWGDVTGIIFNEVASGGQLVFDDIQSGAFASSTTSGGIILSSAINVGTAWLATYGTGFNTYSFQTYIHEIGHALGLGHGGNYNGSADYSSDSLYLNDSWATTIMSYFSQTENTYFQGLGFTQQFVETPMMADIVAMISLYGVNTLTRTGNTTYGFNNTSGRDIFNASLYPTVGYTIYDNGGTDTLDYSGFGQNQTINLNAETFSNIGGRVGNVAIARGTLIENAIGGTGSDTITGNAASNTLTGGGGIDTLSGGAGNDRLVLNAAGSGSSADGGADTDTLAISGAVSLASLVSIEAIELAAGANLTLTTSQVMSGLAANTSVSGSGTITINLQADVFTAVPGFVNAGPTVNFVYSGSAGSDYVKAGHFLNTISGGVGADFLRGGNLVDTIDGGSDADKITGWGGADVLTGGSGNDQFRYFYATDSGLGAAADRITDFTIGGDVIDLRLLDSNLVTPDIQNYALSFIGSAAFGAIGASQIRYGTSGGDMLVQFDLDGNGSSDMEIVLQGLAGQTLLSSSFVFSDASAEPLAPSKDTAPAVMELLVTAPKLPAESLLASDPLLSGNFDDPLAFPDHGLVSWLTPHWDMLPLG